MTHRLQNRIAGSRYALPITMVYAIGIWFMGGLLQQQLWPQFILMLMTTLTMVELNNQHTLIRTYSRMLSCSYLVLSVAALPLFVQLDACIVQLCFALTYLFMFRAYQDKSAISSVFNAFFFIGVASIWFVQILFLLPIWWIILRFYVMGMGWRTFWASLLAVITPYWFVGGYYVYLHDVDTLIHHFSSITDFVPLFDFQSISSLNLLTLCFICALGIIGMLHFLLNSSKDKIRIRLFVDDGSHHRVYHPATYAPTQPLTCTHCQRFTPYRPLYHVHRLAPVGHYLPHAVHHHIDHHGLSTMDTLIDLLIQYGYVGMFLASLLAGSVFPFSSEAVMAGLLAAGLNPWPLVVYGTIGNVMGSLFNYFIGTLGRLDWIEKYLHVKPDKLDRAQRLMAQYGAWIGFFAFLPIIGSAIAIVLGLVRANIWVTIITFTLGKIFRYLLIIYGMNLIL